MLELTNMLKMIPNSAIYTKNIRVLVARCRRRYRNLSVQLGVEANVFEIVMGEPERGRHGPIIALKEPDG